MEVKITIKKTLIAIGIVVALCVASFCAGRFIRFGRISGASQQLIDGIVLTGDQLSQITDELNLEKGAISSAEELGQAIRRGVNTAGSGTELGRVCIDAIEQSIKSDQEFSRNLSEIEDKHYSAVDRALELAIRRAELYESIISTYNETVGNNGKDSK